MNPLRPYPAGRLSLLAAFLGLLPAAAALAELTTEKIAEGLEQPLFVAAPVGDDRLFILEQRGVIRLWKNGAVLPRPFLDIDHLVRDITIPWEERGLLGLAFHPEYATNGRFYVYYTDPWSDGIVAEFYASGDPDSSSADSSRLIIKIEMSHGGHNGGTLAFGPNDGYLYLGLGDGGALTGGDPFNRAQNPDSLLGKMLRIDIDVDSTYAIPPDNPFVDDPGVRDEIWALGFRNPYRWSFDRETGDLYVADVGQADWEEINFEPDSSSGGRNYGWRLMEGEACFNPPTGCNPDSTLALPLYQYPHDGFTCSVTGGYVYRGSQIPVLQGTYFFADFCSDQIWSFRVSAEDTIDFRERTEELAPVGSGIGEIAAFGEDGHGELYLVDRGFNFDPTGEIYRIVDATPVGVLAQPIPAAGLRIQSVAPSPFSKSTRIVVVGGDPGSLTIDIADVRGRLVRTLHDGAAAGALAVSWDGRDSSGNRVATGVYYIRARWAESQTSAKVIFQR